VVSGLADDDLVVISDRTNLFDGDRVEPREVPR
jgi:hypothetical protein